MKSSMIMNGGVRIAQHINHISYLTWAMLTFLLAIAPSTAHTFYTMLPSGLGLGRYPVAGLLAVAFEGFLLAMVVNPGQGETKRAQHWETFRHVFFALAVVCNVTLFTRLFHAVSPEEWFGRSFVSLFSGVISYMYAVRFRSRWLRHQLETDEREQAYRQWQQLKVTIQKLDDTLSKLPETYSTWQKTKKNPALLIETLVAKVVNLKEQVATLEKPAQHVCRHCGRFHTDSQNALKQHERFCLENPKGIDNALVNPDSPHHEYFQAVVLPKVQDHLTTTAS